VKIKFEETPERHREIAELQRKDAERLAKAIESGEQLNGIDQAVAAKLIRRGASTIPLKQKKRAGAPTKIPDTARIEFALLVANGGMTENKAMATLCRRYQVSREAMKKKLGRTGEGPERDIARNETDDAFRFVLMAKPNS
jgi:hypothetical protein